MKKPPKRKSESDRPRAGKGIFYREFYDSRGRYHKIYASSEAELDERQRYWQEQGKSR